MKRLIAFVMLGFSTVCLAACSVMAKNGGVSRKNSLDSAFESTINISLDRLEAEGTVKRFGDGLWSVEFDSPNTLSGIRLEFGDDEVKASYKGLEFSVPQSTVPVKAMMLNLIHAVDENAKYDELTGEEKNGKFIVSGSLEGGDYVLTLNSEGLPECFEMANNKLKMDFLELKGISEGLPQENTTECESASSAEQTEDVFVEADFEAENDFSETLAEIIP